MDYRRISTSSNKSINAQSRSSSTATTLTSSASPVSVEEDISSIHWKILWCQAFPFLCVPSTDGSSLLCYNDATKGEKGNDSLPYSQAQKNSSFALIAFYAIFPHKKSKSSCYRTPTRSFLHPIAANESNSLQYGEILPQTIFHILSLLLHSQHHDQQDEPTGCNPTMLKNVVDIGSGDGTLLFAMSTFHPFHNAVGIEIVPSRHEEAMTNLGLWNSHHHYCCSSTVNTTSFTFLLQDITISSTSTNQLLNKANIVVIHATAFDEVLLTYIEQLLAEQCESGTWIVMVSKPLGGRYNQSKVKNASGTFMCWKILHHGWMDWGCGTIYIQRKL